MGRKRKSECEADFDKEDDPIQRNAANARERSRMRVLSKAFTKLKTTLPWVPPDTKLSKLDTLRLASCYIAHLQQILTDDNCENSPVMAGIATRNMMKQSPANTVHPVALSWPFSFNGSRPSDGINDSGCLNKTPNNKPIIIHRPS